MSTPLDIALQHAALGLHVFPVARDKSTLTRHGYKDASIDPETIRTWWADAIGQSGVLSRCERRCGFGCGLRIVGHGVLPRVAGPQRNPGNIHGPKRQPPRV